MSTRSIQLSLIPRAPANVCAPHVYLDNDDLDCFNLEKPTEPQNGKWVNVQDLKLSDKFTVQGSVGVWSIVFDVLHMEFVSPFESLDYTQITVNGKEYTSVKSFVAIHTQVNDLNESLLETILMDAYNAKMAVDPYFRAILNRTGDCKLCPPFKTQWLRPITKALTSTRLKLMGCYFHALYPLDGWIVQLKQKSKRVLIFTSTCRVHPEIGALPEDASDNLHGLNVQGQTIKVGESFICVILPVDKCGPDVFRRFSNSNVLKDAVKYAMLQDPTPDANEVLCHMPNGLKVDDLLVCD